MEAQAPFQRLLFYAPASKPNKQKWLNNSLILVPNLLIHLTRGGGERCEVIAFLSMYLE
jgi:hypothetical protein